MICLFAGGNPQPLGFLNLEFLRISPVFMFFPIHPFFVIENPEKSQKQISWKRKPGRWFSGKTVDQLPNDMIILYWNNLVIGNRNQFRWIGKWMCS